MNTPIDPDTWVKAVAVLEHARKRGLDPVEHLHRHGLLRTPDLDKAQRVEALSFILNELTSWRPTEMLRSKFTPNHQATPADMYSAIVDWIGKHVEHASRS